MNYFQTLHVSGCRTIKSRYSKECQDCNGFNLPTASCVDFLIWPFRYTFDRQNAPNGQGFARLFDWSSGLFLHLDPGSSFCLRRTAFWGLSCLSCISTSTGSNVVFTSAVLRVCVYAFLPLRIYKHPSTCCLPIL